MSEPQDIIIPLANCHNITEEHVWYGKALQYCPEYRPNDLLFGDFYTVKQSWMRLVVHRCNVEERKLVNKTCAPRDEQDQYLSDNILYLQMRKQVPALQSEDKAVLVPIMMDYDYTIHTAPNITLFSEFSIMKSAIELQDSIMGLFDSPVEKEFAEIT